MRMQTSTEQRRQKIDELERAFLQTVGESTSCGETTADEPGKATTDAGRPGAGAYADEAEKEAKFASMKSVIGIDIERETLQALLEAADGDEELALDVFFAESSRAAHRLGIKSALADDAGQLMAGPRRPYEDLALLLGNGVDAELLAPIATEFSGDLARAVEAYFERTAEHASSAALRARKAAENAEKYYTRPAGRGEAVYCNVYHLHWKETDKSTGDQRAATEENVKGKAKARSNSGLPGVGLGIYHSGLEMYGREVSFGYADGGLTGVFEVPAKCAGGVMPRTTFKESVLLGFMFRSPFEVDHILQRFAAQYRGDAYHLVRCNCNHFTGELAEALVGKGIPSYVNRTANIGKGILGVMALPSQAMGGIFSGLKRAVSNKEGKSRQQQLHDSSGGGAEPGAVTEGLGGLGGDGAAKAGQPAASPVCNLPVASPAASGPMPFAPTHHLVPAYQKRPGAGAAGATPPPRAGAHADQDILFV